ncbi:MAG: hypothetical protein ABJ004_07670 [Cyclobacteriaceae bacterium]
MQIIGLSLIVLCLLSFTNPAFIQAPEDPDPVTDGCTGLSSARAKRVVEFFLTFDALSEERQTVGTVDVSLSEIVPVLDAASCTRLNSIVSNNENFRRVDENLPSDEGKFYYKTDDFYYIFWGLRPAHERIRLGPKKLFIVVSGDFETVWEFYM